MTNWPSFLSEYVALIQSSDIVDDLVSASGREIGANGFTLKVRVRLENGWQLDCWEKTVPGSHRYSYHVFQAGQVIVRWDNAAHHAHLENFPNHQHVGNTIVSSEEMNVASVLAQLESMI